jgi:transposase
MTETPVVLCGIDVGASSLVVAYACPRAGTHTQSWPNTAAGHRDILRVLRRAGGPVRVSLEATGIYWLDLALLLSQAVGVEVAVLNPRHVHRFASTLRRSKTDRADALVLLEYTRRMPFTRWERPSVSALQLRALSRHIDALTAERTAAKNRLHAARASRLTPECVLADLRRAILALGRRILGLRRKAVELLHSDPHMDRRMDLLRTIPGIARISGLQLLAELLLLPPGLSVRQWVAHSGLDPAHRQSGTSMHLPSRISRTGNRHLRRALYMPALAAARHDPHLRGFYTALIARHKTPMQALVAVARKLLHAIYGVLKTQTPYQGNKLLTNLQIS